MSQYGSPPPTGTGERWAVNMPAVIGVVFVFLVGVIVWVIARGGGDESVSIDTGVPPTTQAIVAPAPSTAVGTTVASPDESSATTTPAPMPDLTQVSSTSSTSAPASTVATTTTTPPTTPTTATPPTTAPVTTAPGAPAGAVPGDLAIAGRPMQRPPCDGGYITILGSAIGDQATAAGIAQVLGTYPGSEYLRTDQTCSSLRASVDGAAIYVVYLGPFTAERDACAARARGPEGAYAKQLSNDIGPDRAVNCPS